jgi:hypothetical protein
LLGGFATFVVVCNLCRCLQPLSLFATFVVVCASEWTRVEWALWWNNELRMAQAESDRLWRGAVANPDVFGDVAAQWVVGTPLRGVTLQ